MRLCGSQVYFSASEIRRVGITEKVWDTQTENWQLTTDHWFLWDGLTIAEQRSGSNGATVEKRFFPQGVEIVTGANSGTYTYRTDHLGSVREVVDDQGGLTAHFDYSPWGEFETVSGSFDLDFGFTGHFIHQPTGLYFAPFRAYDAGLGRWLSRDPIEEFGNDGFNLYSYVRNNPINRIDPFGLEGLTVPIGEFEGAGDALERIGRQIEAGDRMGQQLANKHQRPGLIQRSVDFCRRNTRALKNFVGGFGRFSGANDVVSAAATVPTSVSSINARNRALDAALKNCNQTGDRIDNESSNVRNLSNFQDRLVQDLME